MFWMSMNQPVPVGVPGELHIGVFSWHEAIGSRRVDSGEVHSVSGVGMLRTIASTAPATLPTSGRMARSSISAETTSR